MAVVVVGGSGKDIGKTTLVCAVISALRDLGWTAIKITGHDYGSAEEQSNPADELIREERHPGQETDTARYLAAGARRALLVTRASDELPIDEIWMTLRKDRNIIFESNRIIDAVTPDVCLALVGGHDKKPSFERLLQVADALLTVHGSAPERLPPGIRRFELDAPDRLPAELVIWLRDRLANAAT